MQYYIYQHNDGTNDTSVYNQFRGSNVICLAENQDWLIMKARSYAKSRGASPLEIQQMVESFESKD